MANLYDESLPEQSVDYGNPVNDSDAFRIAINNMLRGRSGKSGGTVDVPVM